MTSSCAGVISSMRKADSDAGSRRMRSMTGKRGASLALMSARLGESWASSVDGASGDDGDDGSGRDDEVVVEESWSRVVARSKGIKRLNTSMQNAA
jgi:hypothetical protein